MQLSKLPVKHFCLLFFVPFENSSNHVEMSSLPFSSENSFRVSHFLWRGASVYYSHLRDSWHSHRAFGSEAVTTCFNVVGIRTLKPCLDHLELSRLGFGHPTFCLQGKCSNRLRHLIYCSLNVEMCLIYIFIHVYIIINISIIHSIQKICKLLLTL